MTGRPHYKLWVRTESTRTLAEISDASFGETESTYIGCKNSLQGYAAKQNVEFQYSVLLHFYFLFINPLTPNDLYMSRTAPLTSKHCILYIYSTIVCTEYFKRALYSPFFFSSKCSLFHNANFFGSCIIHILYTECAEIKKKKNSGVKGLRSDAKYSENGFDYVSPYFLAIFKNNGGNAKSWTYKEPEFFKCKSSAYCVSGISVFANYLNFPEVSADSNEWFTNVTEHVLDYLRVLLTCMTFTASYEEGSLMVGG